MCPAARGIRESMSELLVASRGVFTRNLVLDEQGIRRGGTTIAWDDVHAYYYDWTDWSRPADFIVERTSGAQIRIAPVFDQWELVTERVLRELHGRLRGRARFAPFAFEADALVHRIGRVPIAELERVELGALGASVAVEVHARGKGVWTELDAGMIANLWLWLEALAERGVVIASALQLWLTPSLAALGDRMAAVNRLPRATVVR